MVNKDKVLKLCIPFHTKEAHEGEEQEELVISGHASTNDEDRMGDIIVSDAWKKPGALKNYLKNPVILAFHDMMQPIGKMIDYDTDSRGLKVKAKISKSADKIVNLINEGILSAFSVGFMIKDADFDAESGIFIIKELELFEISVVSIPANQDAIFSVEKNFSDRKEYLEFRKQFIKESEETLMDKDKDKGQSPVDVASLAKEIGEQVRKDLEAEKKAKEEKERADREAAASVENIAVTAAERIVKDLREELVNKDKDLSEALEGIREALGKNKDEVGEVLTATNKGKMEYAKSNDERWKAISADTRDGMLYAAKMLGMDITETKTFKEFVTKSGMEHWDPGVTGEWEDEYSTRVQDAMRERLVVEPIFPTIPMSTPTLNMPINPEAGDASWVHNSALRSSQNPSLETGGGTDVSTGAAVDHQLDEQTIIAYKLATREYIGYEEEEDSIVALAPIIRDAVSRRMAKTADLALLRGQGVLTNTSGYDPILGIEGRGASTTDVEVIGAATWGANFTEDAVVDMRRNLGIYGLDPENLVLLCSHDLYYEIMKLDNFKTVNTLGLDRATIRTGQVGELFGIDVLVSQQFDNAAITAGTVGTTLGILVRPENFVLGNLRGLMTESFQDVVNQKRGIVSSRRFGFQEIITGQATVNLQIAS